MKKNSTPELVDADIQFQFYRVPSDCVAFWMQIIQNNRITQMEML